MLLNILLVDDEYIVLKGLEMILTEQTEVKLKVVTAMDAADALEKLSSFRPDVMITDINMPEANGFELIGQVQQSFPHCRFIVCSGYDEQGYLKQALHLHVADYLLKPVDKALLIHRLKELADEKERLISHTLLRIQLLLLKGKNGSEEDFSSNELEYIFPNPAFCLCAINAADADPAKIQKQMVRYFDTIYTLTLNSRIIFLLNYSDKIHPNEVRSILGSLLGRHPWGNSCFTADSGKVPAIRSISVRYQEALCEMVLSQSPEPEEEHAAVLLGLISARTLFPAIRVVTFEDNIEDYIEALYENIPGDFYYSLVFVEIFSAYILVSDISLPVDLLQSQYPPAQPDTACTRKSLIRFVKKILNFWYESFSQAEHINCSSKIASACRYIELHYKEDLSLDQIAEILAMNASYLSYIFKKETGSTLVQYLTNIRMQQACELLRSRPDLSLEEIAVQTGYNSTTYFHKIFRSRFGISPRQWQLSNAKDSRQM